MLFKAILCPPDGHTGAHASYEKGKKDLPLWLKARQIKTYEQGIFFIAVFIR
jgi:hypothetical protein